MAPDSCLCSQGDEGGRARDVSDDRAGETSQHREQVMVGSRCASSSRCSAWQSNEACCCPALHFSSSSLPCLPSLGSITIGKEL